MKKGLIIFCMILVCLSVGCSNVENVKEKDTAGIDFSQDMIEIKFVNESYLEAGIGFTLELKNISDVAIAQNDVYMYFPIKNGDGTRRIANKSMVIGEGNKLNIAPGESVSLHFFFQRENYISNELIDIEYPNVQFKGYFEEVKIENRFTQGGDLAAFDKSYKSMSDKRIEKELQIAEYLRIIQSSPALSSNPYDYIKEHRAEYDAIIAYDNVALTYLLRRLESSNNNGLEEYIMAVACSELLGEAEEKDWETGKQWLEKYKTRSN